MTEKSTTTTNGIAAPKPSISEWVANAIADTGCRIVFGGHGGAVVPLVNAVCAHPQLTWVCARNEHDAATMAAAHAKLTGGLGVVIATSGPGATNLVTGLMEAQMDKVALLAITGMKPTAQLGYAEFQDVCQSRLFSGAGIEWSKDAASADGVIPLLRDAVSTALTRRTCAHLAIPVDIQAAPSPLHFKHFCASHAGFRARPAHVDSEVLDEAAATLVGRTASSTRNIIAVGLRGCYSDNEDDDMGAAILELAEALSAPVLTRLDAKGVVDELHPLSFGVVGVHGKPGMETAATLISSSDRVVCIGVDDETLLLCNLAGLQIRKVIEIEPDAFGLSTRFDAEHSLVGNVADVCRQLALRVEILTAKRNKKAAISESMRISSSNLSNSAIDSSHGNFDYMTFKNPMAKMVTTPTLQRSLSIPNVDDIAKDAGKLWETFHRRNWSNISATQAGLKYQTDLAGISPHFCHPALVMGAISRARRNLDTDPASRDATICVDVGDVTLWASLSLSLQGGSRTLYSERLGTMGYALNAGVAAVLARPAPAGAVVLAGDGGFQMSLQELATFQQMRRPGDKLLCVVFDNQYLGRVAFGFNNAKGCEMIGPDYVALAKAYGGDGIRLDKSTDAEEVVQKAMSADGLFMIHVCVDPEVKADMAAFKDNSLTVMNSG